MNAIETQDDILGTVPEQGSTTEFELLDAGAYKAILRDVQTVNKPDWKLKGDEQGDDLLQREWKYELTEEGFEGYMITDWTSLSFHPKSYGYARACALYGREIPAHEQIKKSKCVGQPCQVVVKVYTNKQGVKKNDVDTVLPPKKRRNTQEEVEPEDIPFD